MLAYLIWVPVTLTAGPAHLGGQLKPSLQATDCYSRTTMLDERSSRDGWCLIIVGEVAFQHPDALGWPWSSSLSEEKESHSLLYSFAWSCQETVTRWTWRPHLSELKLFRDATDFQAMLLSRKIIAHSFYHSLDLSFCDTCTVGFEIYWWTAKSERWAGLVSMSGWKMSYKILIVLSEIQQNPGFSRWVISPI